MGNLRTCKIHDLLRDLCLKEASKTNFLRIVQKERPGILKVSNNERRIVVRRSASKVINYFYRTGVLQSPALLRTLIFDGTLPSIAYKSLRVLSPVKYSWTLKIRRKNLVKVMHNLVNLRCLHFSTKNPKKLLKIPPSIVCLWNLQSLDIGRVDKVVEAPSNIWEMSQLRHIRIFNLCLPDPPSGGNDILKNLQSAKRIFNFSFSEESIKRLPNIKELDVSYDKNFKGTCSLNNIALLENLESFSCSIDNESSSTMRNGMLSNLTFPLSLKRLAISHLKLDDVMSKIGSLPLLEVLYLAHCSGNEWELVGQFDHLKRLRLCRCPDLEYFTADNNHFPCLEQLILEYMDRLKEISLDIADITTLGSIVLYDCPDSAVLSAKEIADHQYQIANEELEVRAIVVKKYSLFYDESMSTSNFKVKIY